MIKVMIVDDEKIFRDFLRTVIPWTEYGFEIYSEAKNGIDAYDKIREQAPDVMLVDINMPFMDGLQLSEKIRADYPEVYIVLITGHSEFEYAKKAVKLGLNDYILKPFEQEELINTLIAIRHKLEKQSLEKTNLQTSINFMYEGFLNSLVNADYTKNDEETLKQMELLNIKCISQIYLVSSIEIDSLHDLCNNAEEVEHWKSAISNILTEAIKVNGSHIAFNGPEDRIISLIEFDSDTSSKNFDVHEYDKLCEMVKKHLDITVSVGVGTIHNHFRGIRKSYLESVTALKEKLLNGSSHVNSYGSCNDKCRTTGFYTSNTSEYLLNKLRLHDSEGLQSKLDEIFHQIKESNISIEYTYSICFGLISLCLSYIVEAGYRIEDIYGAEFSPFTEVRSKENLEVLRTWLMNVFQQAMNCSAKTRYTRSAKLVQDIIDYIKNNFSRDSLCIDEISRNLYFNASYIRSVFKNETGYTIMDYITQLRMDKARKLLSQGNINLSEIALLVGYSDPGYFSKCFKKTYGISPSYFANLKEE